MPLPQDLKLAFRGLARQKTATLLICGSLALAVAGNAIVFSLIEALVLRPFPYPDSENLVLVWQENREQPDDQTPASPADFADWRQRAESFSQLEALRPGSFNLTGGDQPEEVQALLTTPGGLALLGAEPLLGRSFLPEEGVPGRERVVVLAHDLWQRRFGGDPAVVGRTVELDDRSYTVIGVLPAEFEFFLPAGVWAPLAFDPAALPRDRHDLLVLGRLAAGVGPDQARSEMAALGRQLEAEHPQTNRGLGATVLTLREQVPGPTDRQLFALLQGGMLFVLLIACANVANILLARGQDRQREIALRTTLGAGRRRVVRQLLVESLALAAAGGGLGLALAGLGIDLLATMTADELPKMATPALNPQVAAFTLGIAAAAGLLFGLAPALAASRPDLAATLKEGARGSTGSRRRRLVSRALVVVEVALALVMLSGTGLLVRSMIELQSLDPGFPAQDLLTFRLSLPEARYPEPEGVARFYGTLLEELEALPGVTGATAVTSLPRSRNTPSAPFTRDGAPAPESGQPPSAVLLAVAPGYFEELGVPLLAGRPFAAADRPDAVPVAVISRAMAQRFFPEQDPLGKSLTIEGASRRIVGVAGDVVQGRLLDREGPSAIVYLPHPQQPARALYLMLRTAGPVPGLPEQVRQLVWALDAALPVARMQTLEEHIAAQFTGARVIATLVGAFGLVALLLAAVGIYGIVSYSVSQRTHEIGVRMAIGARRGHVLGQVTRQGLLLAGVGLALAVPGVLLVIRAIRTVLGEIAPVAVATVPALAVLLAAVALFASYLPARRAAGLDPVTALRTE